MTLDEELSEAVRKFKCLYDKSKKGHHDKNMIKNCWSQVEKRQETLDLYPFLRFL